MVLRNQLFDMVINVKSIISLVSYYGKVHIKIIIHVVMV